MNRFIKTLIITTFLLAGHSAQAQDITDHSLRAQSMINDLRKSRKSLRAHPDLIAAAAAHAQDLSRSNRFSHTGSNGSSIGQRVKAQGYRFYLAAENIAKGQGSLNEVLIGWMNSKGHRKNMLHKKARDFGLVSTNDGYWVMVLGAQKC